MSANTTKQQPWETPYPKGIGPRGPAGVEGPRGIEGPPGPEGKVKEAELKAAEAQAAAEAKAAKEAAEATGKTETENARIVFDVRKFASVQATIEAAEAAPMKAAVWIPNEQVLPAGLVIKGNNVILEGPGTLKLGANKNERLLTIQAGADNIVIRGLNFDGNSAAQTVEAGAILIKGEGSENIKILNNTFRNVFGKGVNVSKGTEGITKRLLIQGNTFVNISGYAIQPEWNCPGVQVLGNTIETCGGNGIWVGNESNFSSVQGNTVIGSGRIGIEVWHNLLGHHTINNNIVIGSASFGISLSRGPYSSIIGNTVKEATTIGVEAASSNFVTISGNVVQATTGPEVTTGSGIALDGNEGNGLSSWCSIVGNTITESKAVAIHLSGTAGAEGLGNVIAHNTITATNTAASGLPDIRVRTLYPGTIVSGNRIHKTTSGFAVTFTTDCSVIGNRITYEAALTGTALEANTAERVVIANNSISGTFSTGINIPKSKGAMITGNRVSGSLTNGILGSETDKSNYIVGNVIAPAGGSNINVTAGAEGPYCVSNLVSTGLTNAGPAKPEVTGSRAGGEALKKLLEELAKIGIITNGTTA